MSYNSILLKFRSCLMDIGNALREVLGTSDKYKITDIANEIRNCNQVFYLGTGLSFDVSGIDGYKNLTVDNFLVDCGTYSVSAACSLGGSGSNSATLTKSYDASKGILTIGNASVSASGGTTWNAVWEYGDGFSDKYVYGSASVSRQPQVWLCKGQIRNLEILSPSF